MRGGGAVKNIPQCTQTMSRNKSNDKKSRNTETICSLLAGETPKFPQMPHSFFTWSAVGWAAITVVLLVRLTHVASRRTCCALCARALVRTWENGNRPRWEEEQLSGGRLCLTHANANEGCGCRQFCTALCVHVWQLEESVRGREWHKTVPSPSDSLVFSE